MDIVYLTGRFVAKGSEEPIDGPVELIPSRMWFEENGVAYAMLAPSTITTNGRFTVPLTACVRKSGNPYGWYYQIKCPMGIWTIQPDGKNGEVLELKNMLPMRY